MSDLVAGGTKTAWGRIRRPWSPVAVNKVISTIDQVLNDALDQKIVTSNVAAKIARVSTVHCCDLLRQQTFYMAVYRPAVLRANRLDPSARLSPDLKFHSLRHLREPVRRCRDCPAGDLAVYGSRESDHNTGDLHAPVRDR